MADISITAANVKPGAGAFTKTGTAGETITAGQALYIDAANDGVLKKANSATSASTAVCVGIALNGAATGQPVAYQTTGVYTVGGTVAASVAYALSGAADGGIAPVSDITVSGEILTVLMIGISATQAQIFLVSAGVAHA